MKGKIDAQKTLSRMAVFRYNKTKAPKKNLPKIEISTPTINPQDNDDELILLQNQRSNLQARLAKIQEEYKTEQNRKAKLEKEIQYARSQMNKKFSKTQIGNELQSQSDELQLKLEGFSNRYQKNLDKLKGLREQILDLQALPSSPFSKIQLAKDSVSYPPISQSEKPYIKHFTTISHNYQQKINSKLDQGESNPKAEEIILESHEMEADLTELIVETGHPTLESLFIDSWKIDDEIDELEQIYHNVLDKKAMLEAEKDRLIKERKAKEKEIELRDAKGYEELKMIFEEIGDVKKQLKRLNAERDQKENEMSDIFSEINALFNTLECSWGNDSEKPEVDSSNAVFAMNSIESLIVDTFGK